MAKARTATRKPTRKGSQKPAEAPRSDAIPPEEVHRLLGIVGPYGEYEEPIPTKGYVNWWDPGCSLLTLSQKQPGLFTRAPWLDSQGYAKLSDCPISPVSAGEIAAKTRRFRGLWDSHSATRGSGVRST